MGFFWPFGGGEGSNGAPARFAELEESGRHRLLLQLVLERANGEIGYPLSPRVTY